MAHLTVPDNVGKCFVALGPTGKHTVYNHQSGKNRICVPYNSREEADRICDRLNSGDHNGTIRIPEPRRR